MIFVKTWLLPVGELGFLQCFSQCPVAAFHQADLLLAMGLDPLVGQPFWANSSRNSRETLQLPLSLQISGGAVRAASPTLTAPMSIKSSRCNR